MDKKNLSKQKQNGVVYTPERIVKNILDMVGYSGTTILKKHIIDNSCGDGAFLTEVVDRYCDIAIQQNLTNEEIKKDLELYIHGIELDQIEAQKCKENLNNIAKKYNIHDVKWDVLCENTLLCTKYFDKMDFVVGNPPYVRVHNLNDLNLIKKFIFSKNGMTDLFITFFEIGVKMLNKNGVLGYITPSSWFTSIAGSTMREFFVNHNLLDSIVDFKHTQVFDATTYSAITILSKLKQTDKINYFEYDDAHNKETFIDVLNIKDCYLNNKFYFSSTKNLHKLKDILCFTPICSNCLIDVKNGFATLCDDFFIQDEFPFDNCVIPIMKASTGKWKKCLFPYDKTGKIIPIDKIQSNRELHEYFTNNIEKLKNRSIDNKLFWWGFGRTQGIKDVYKNKYVINSLIKSKKDIKLQKCASGTGIYSGLYILTELSLDEIQSILYSQEFIDYISMLGKYKSGGYYTYSSKDLKQFLTYYINNQ